MAKERTQLVILLNIECWFVVNEKVWLEQVASFENEVKFSSVCAPTAIIFFILLIVPTGFIDRQKVIVAAHEVDLLDAIALLA